jgi:hypothetical protein
VAMIQVGVFVRLVRRIDRDRRNPRQPHLGEHGHDRMGATLRTPVDDDHLAAIRDVDCSHRQPQKEGSARAGANCSCRKEGAGLSFQR